jgi:hypothetical protein
MGFLSAYSDTRTIPIDRHYWVELREHLPQGAREASERALARIEMVDGAARPAPDVALSRQLTVLAAIVSWNLDDDDGAVWPINLDSVRSLPGGVFDTLWKTVDELGSPRTPQEAQRFPDGGVGGDPAGVTGPAESADVPAGAGHVAAPWAAQGGLGVTP